VSVTLRCECNKDLHTKIAVIAFFKVLFAEIRFYALVMNII